MLREPTLAPQIRFMKLLHTGKTVHSYCVYGCFISIRGYAFRVEQVTAGRRADWWLYMENVLCLGGFALMQHFW